MKNIRKKIASLILLAVISISILASIGVANAYSPFDTASEAIEAGITAAPALAAALDDLRTPEKECMPPGARDGEYITVIIEEPIAARNEGSVGDKYFTRICYRNTFEFNNETLRTLSTECSETAKNLFNQYRNSGIGVAFSCQQVEVLFSKGGTSLIEGYIGSIYRWSAGIVGIIAVLIIVASGIQISASGGDSQAIESAKTRIIKSLAGIVVLFLSGLILYTVNPTFFVSSVPEETTETTQTTETTTP
jgi:hypothetical protein